MREPGVLAPAASGGQAMRLSHFIRPEHVLAGLAPASKSKLLQAMSKVAAGAVGLPEALVFDCLHSREKLGSTGIGNGIAIPHARLARLERPFGMAARLGKPIDFESVDEIPVDIVVLLLTPAGAGKDHLNVLSCIARRLRSPEILQDLRRAPDAGQLYRALVGPPA